jgi:hypothetical protein
MVMPGQSGGNKRRGRAGMELIRSDQVRVKVGQNTLVLKTKALVVSEIVDKDKYVFDVRNTFGDFPPSSRNFSR